MLLDFWKVSVQMWDKIEVNLGGADSSLSGLA